jgi:hypothetical protein
MAFKSLSLMNWVELLKASLIDPKTTPWALRPVLRNWTTSPSFQRDMP